MTAPNRILVMRSPGETRAALLADEELLEIVHARDNHVQPGAVYIGRVGERVPGTADVFVDIGLSPNGVLETKGKSVPAGQWLAVEVITPARADKGPKLTLSDSALPNVIKAPGLLKPAPDAVAVWCERYGESIKSITVTPRAAAKRLSAILGAKAEIIETSSELSLFDEIDEQIDAAMRPDVKLPSGGRLYIEHTKALTAIDIDSGGSSAQSANSEAMHAIAKHLRLRNVAGHILIDLISMRNGSRFLKELAQACEGDPAQAQVMGLTPSGMIDVLRRRTRVSLAETLCDVTLVRLSPETVGLRALRLACRELLARRSFAIELHVASAVSVLLNESLASALSEARSTASGEIKVIPHPEFIQDRFEVS